MLATLQEKKIKPGFPDCQIGLLIVAKMNEHVITVVITTSNNKIIKINSFRRYSRKANAKGNKTIISKEQHPRVCKYSSILIYIYI